MSRSIMLQQLQALGNNCLTLKGGGCFFLKKNLLPNLTEKY